MRYKVTSTTVFDKWLSKLEDRPALNAIVLRLAQIEAGKLGEVESVAGRVNKMSILAGEGYNIYFATQNGNTVILLCGSVENNEKFAIAGAG